MQEMPGSIKEQTGPGKAQMFGLPIAQEFENFCEIIMGIPLNSND